MWPTVPKGVQSSKGVGRLLLTYLYILEDKALVEDIQIDCILCVQIYLTKVQTYLEPTKKGR